MMFLICFDFVPWHSFLRNQTVRFLRTLAGVAVCLLCHQNFLHMPKRRKNSSIVGGVPSCYLLAIYSKKLPELSRSTNETRWWHFILGNAEFCSTFPEISHIFTIFLFLFWIYPSQLIHETIVLLKKSEVTVRCIIINNNYRRKWHSIFPYTWSNSTGERVYPMPFRINT